MEIFFEFCTKYKVVDIVQTFKGYDYNLLRRIPISRLAKVAESIQEERKEMIMFKVYAQLLSRMTKENFISFSDFMALAEKDNRKKEDIEAEFAKMEKEMEGANGAI